VNSIGEVLEILRRAEGLTQEELCARAGVTQAALSRYENDQRRPDGETVERLARGLRDNPFAVTERHLQIV